MNKNKKLVIAINGIATSGKDELVLQIQNKYDTLNFKIGNISSVEDIKDIAIKYFGWDGVKDEKGRNLLSSLKDASTNYNDKPFNDYVNKILEGHLDAYFVHIREVEEIEKLRKLCDTIPYIEFVSLKVERSSVENKYTNNTGDVGATIPYDYTYTLNNDKSISDWVVKSQNWFETITTPIYGKLDTNVR